MPEGRLLICGMLENALWLQLCIRQPPSLGQVRTGSLGIGEYQLTYLLLLMLVIGPLVGGFVSENPKLDWRFNFWIMMIFSGTIYVIAVLFMPETVSFAFVACLILIESYGMF